MASKHTEIFNALTREVEARGCDNFEFTTGNNHDKLIMRRGDKSRFVVFSRHAADRRAIKNNVATVRKELTALGFPA